MNTISPWLILTSGASTGFGAMAGLAGACLRSSSAARARMTGRWVHRREPRVDHCRRSRARSYRRGHRARDPASSLREDRLPLRLETRLRLPRGLDRLRIECSSADVAVIDPTLSRSLACGDGGRPSRRAAARPTIDRERRGSTRCRNTGRVAVTSSTTAAARGRRTVSCCRRPRPPSRSRTRNSSFCIRCMSCARCAPRVHASRRRARAQPSSRASAVSRSGRRRPSRRPPCAFPFGARTSLGASPASAAKASALGRPSSPERAQECSVPRCDTASAPRGPGGHYRSHALSVSRAAARAGSGATRPLGRGEQPREKAFGPRASGRRSGRCADRRA